MSTKNTKCSAGLRSGLLVSFVAMTIAGCGGGGGGGGSGPGSPVPSPAPAPAASAPSIVTQPAAVTVADGAIVQFSISATGDAPLTYQWRRNGADLADGAGITGATTATMSLSAPYPYNASQISVRVSNAAGNVVSGNALLTVTAVAPTIATVAANTNVVAGSAATLSPAITGGTAPITYQWKRDGKVVAGATSASYTIATADFRDNAAVFVLDITNPAGSFSTQPTKLAVLPPGTTTVLTVDTTDDLVDGDTADGKCLTIANNCSLRAAVMQADASTDLVTAINVPAGIYKLTRQPSGIDDGTTGNLNLSTPAYVLSTIYITGAGAARTIIDASQLDNVLDLKEGRVATLSGLTLRNGQTVNSPEGGIIANLGGSLTLSDCVIESGRALVSGGGIYSSGVLTIRRSTIRSSIAQLGGGISNFGTTRVYDSTISGNYATYGGGIYNQGITYVVNSTVSSNWADTDGGGIYATASLPGFPITTAIYSTSIIGNDADHDRDQLGGNGGGVFNYTGSRFIAVNSLLARNTLLDSPQYDDCNGNLELYGFLLIGEAGSCTFSGNQKWYLAALDTIDPALKDNGGPTFTHATSEGGFSPSDFGFAACSDENDAPLTTDQRGAPRGDGCDIGAYELGAVVP